VSDNPISGAYVYGIWRKEATFGSDPGGTSYSFGHDLRFTIEPKNNLIKVGALGSRNYAAFLEGKYEGRLTVEGTLGNTRWFAIAWGAAATASSAPYNHTYSEATALPSMTIEVGSDLGTTDSIRKLLGCKCDELNVSGAIGETFKFRATFFYKTESEGSSLTSNVVDAEVPFTFANCSVDRPDASTIANVQRVEYTLKNNILEVWGLGSRFHNAQVGGLREHNFTYEHTFENSAELEAFYGAGAAPNATIAETSLTINITNGLSGANERHLNIAITGVKFETERTPSAPNELIIETMTGFGRTCTAIGQDATSTTPFD
jgi:hypothetical protein